MSDAAPFTKSNLEDAHVLISQRYGLSERSGRRYARAFADTLFRLRGRRITTGGRGNPLRFTETDWEVFQEIYERWNVQGSQQLIAAITFYYMDMDLLEKPGVGLLEVIADMRASVDRLSQHVMGERAQAPQTPLEQVLDARVAALLTFAEAQQKLTESLAQEVTSQRVGQAQTFEQMARIEEGIRHVMEWVVEQR